MQRVIIILLTFICLQSFGQESKPESKQKKLNKQKGLLYYKEFTIGGKITSNGWAVTSEIGKILNIHNTRIFEFEFAGIKDPREHKQQATSFTNIGLNFTPKDFYYGQQNQFFTLRAGFGYKHNIAEKAEKSGVALTLVYVGGVSLGLAKPYYLDLAYITQLSDSVYLLDVRSEKYNPDPVKGNAQKYLNWYDIIGSSGFGKGLGEIQPIPGIYGKAALNFEWGAKDNFITALEAGVNLDLYYKKVPILINQNNNFMFWSVFLSFQLGKRS